MQIVSQKHEKHELLQHFMCRFRIFFLDLKIGCRLADCFLSDFLDSGWLPTKSENIQSLAIVPQIVVTIYVK